jgi:hypothetical protein
MSAIVEQIKAMAVNMEYEEVSELANFFTELAEPHDGMDEAEWLAEMERRVKSIEDGTAKTIPFETVLNKWKERVR